MGAIWAIASFNSLSSNDRLTSVVWCVIPILAFYLGAVTFAVTCVKLNWMSWKEAGEFLTPRTRWPQTWLEPSANDN